MEASEVDFLSKFGAEHLVRRIRDYWEARGIDVELRVVEGWQARERAFYSVRSSLKLELPRRGEP